MGSANRSWHPLNDKWSLSYGRLARSDDWTRDARAEFEGVSWACIADFLDGRRDDGSGIFGVAEFQVHAAADVLQLEHGAAPGGAGNRDLHRLGAEFGMAGEQRFAAAQKHGGVAVVHGLDLEDGGRRKVVEKNSAFDFRLDDAAVHFVSQVGVRVKHADDRDKGIGFLGQGQESFGAGAESGGA